MPPAVLPKRVRIHQAILTRLERIKDGVGYFTTPALVTMSPLELSDYKGDGTLERGPVLGVLRADGSTLALDTQEGGYVDLHKISILGYVKAATSWSATDMLELLWADQKNALLADRTLGGLARSIRPDGERITDKNLFDPYAAFEQPWAIEAEDEIPGGHYA